MSSSGLDEHSGKAASVVRNALRSALSRGDPKKATRSRSPARGPANTVAAIASAMVTSAAVVITAVPPASVLYAIVPMSN